jgi:cysteine dioxygenase
MIELQQQLSKVSWMNLYSKVKSSPKDLPRLLSNLGVSADKLSELSQESNSDAEPYGRKILFSNESIEVMLAHWTYQAAASPHNHGQSGGLIWFVKGNFYEQHFRFLNSNLEKTDQKILYKENDVVQVDPSHIHSCQPEHSGLSLHIYSPPIHRMKVWDLKNKQTLIVADHCGAWIPADFSLILEKSNWHDEN